MVHNSDNKDKVAIIIPTKNRSDFLIRQLHYYASTNSPHPVYIADSSNPEHLEKVQKVIERLKDKLKINYYTYHKNDKDYVKFLLSMVKEPYVCFNGDDDFQVTSTLTKCAQFLDQNSDYESAGGVSVTFETEDNKPYGKLKLTHDYPRYEVGSETAAQRLIDFLGNYFTSMVSVNRTVNMAKQWDNKVEIKLDTFRDEMIPCCLTLISGKAKLIDNVGFVHQIHGNNSPNQLDMHDWLTHPDWRSSYLSFKDRLAEAIMVKDGISREKAEYAVKLGFWAYLAKYVPKRYAHFMYSVSNPEPQVTLRHKLATRLPLIKTLYHRYVQPMAKSKIRLHYEVLNPHSRYYKDCKPVWDSIESIHQEKSN